MKKTILILAVVFCLPAAFICRDWIIAESPMAQDGNMKVVYEVTSNGSAVVERMGPGTPFEMVSVYYDEKGKLAMTHSCAVGNQPKLALKSSSPDKINMVFAKNNTINPKKEGHMHGITISFVSPDQITEECTGMMNGKETKTETFTLTRVKG